MSTEGLKVWSVLFLPLKLCGLHLHLRSNWMWMKFLNICVWVELVELESLARLPKWKIACRRQPVDVCFRPVLAVLWKCCCVYKSQTWHLFFVFVFPVFANKDIIEHTIQVLGSLDAYTNCNFSGGTAIPILPGSNFTVGALLSFNFTNFFSVNLLYAKLNLVVTRHYASFT